MPTLTVVIPVAPSIGRAATAILKTGKKCTVRFVPRPRRAELPAPFSATHADQRLIDGARMTAHNYRQLAEKAGTAQARKAMEDNAAKWERRAEELTATKHGPQQPTGGLFQ